MGYYSENLAGERLRRCYEIAPPRVKQYLECEIQHVLSRIEPGDSVLELGCGYGRVARELAGAAGRVVGIDTAAESIDLARSSLPPGLACEFLKMDAVRLGFADDEFDIVVCVQNGICAFGVDQEALIREAVRVSRPGGLALFSSYSERFWSHRLEWFQLQAAEGLLGQIDRDATGGGVIVCRDGFRAGAMGADGFLEACRRAGVECSVIEVDESSVFCEIVKTA
jgi:2-polyprenyl-6-hydroxyphenyl methylase/3-demethylubiquinone-9 3-methyltransferase